MDGIAEYIARDNPSRGFSFVAEIQGTLHLLAENPLAGRDRSEIKEGLRSFPHGNYVVFYRPLPDGIVVLRVIHGSRDHKRMF
ncbi:MAG: hypothetical protein A3G18_06880 [Rhodospirillales bacterium RIFCSPLOWO2_12_FULL_58_28]|nr:MAG: hypothetical protein A3H92_11445 [Rhodospirillales bacterium RIFCSPLOWO2_02_FULL_58_16]OHC77445.1 MAG: hypothetical protein A3G18_06880 [Rhodospirillales bacterium RIFCSPLOWO2_12_FULL_58_28]